MKGDSCLVLMRPSILSVVFSVFLWFIPGLADVSAPANSGTESPNHSSKKSTVLVVLGVCLGVLALVGGAVIVFKFWQRKRREEQHPRLLKLFEEDDDLNVELGI